MLLIYLAMEGDQVKSYWLLQIIRAHLILVYYHHIQIQNSVLGDSWSSWEVFMCTTHRANNCSPRKLGIRDAQFTRWSVVWSTPSCTNLVPYQ